MALERFYVPTDGITDKLGALICGFNWLLGRPESELHIAANKKDNLIDSLDVLKSHYGGNQNLVNLFAALIGGYAFTVTDPTSGLSTRITGSALRPYCQARPNGACLLIWGDSNQAGTVEQRLGPVGSICVAPWGINDIKDWINNNSPTRLEC